MSFRKGGGRGGGGGRAPQGKVGPAIMLMPNHIRAIFMPNPPLKHIPPREKARKHAITGVAEYMSKFDDENTVDMDEQDTTIQDLKERKRRAKEEKVKKELEPKTAEYREQQKASNGEFEGMNCYNTLFIGRLAYEVTERKLLREMESYGPVKDLKIVKDKEEKSRGYAFVEFENEEDMKKAYRAADGMRIEGRHIVCDVERGHTVPSWLPRRLGGGLGGTRIGSRFENVTRPGRYDPSKPEPVQPPPMMPPGGGGPPPPGYYRGGGPPPPPGPYNDYRGPPPPDHGPYGRKRGRSRSPDRGHYGRRRY